jgi:hypothetical protein
MKLTILKGRTSKRSADSSRSLETADMETDVNTHTRTLVTTTATTPATATTIIQIRGVPLPSSGTETNHQQPARLNNDVLI